jgi:PhnB protein
MPSRLNPYLSFSGNAREAMEFYRGVFGGRLDTTTFAEGGIEHDPADAERLMHSQLEADNGMILMGSDAPSGTAPVAEAPSSVGLSLSGDDEAELSGYYKKLSDGGTVTMPLEKAPWGDQFGMVTDRFGMPWMVNITGTPQG